jgi:hypothetical protein
MYSRQERNFDQLISSTQSNPELGPATYQFEEPVTLVNRRRGYYLINIFTLDTLRSIV